jgi:hypothetical protein
LRKSDGLSPLQRNSRTDGCRCDEIAETENKVQISRDTEMGFLCSPDCVAEREGFEPSVQVLARTTV